MSIFSFTNPVNGQKFEIEGPPALTEAQARQIFEQQLNAGALVGLKPGDVIDSASQALDGVVGAAGQLAQQVQNIAGGAQGALTGALSTVTGAVQGAVTGVTGAVAQLGQQATQFASALPSAINSATSVASKAISGITSSVTNLIPTNPINVGDLAKQATALLPIQGLPQLDVRAAMSQATNLVGQAANTLSNIGVGKFGLDAQQLELSGILKPGMASLVGATNQITGAVNSLTSVLSSPAAFTGKLGINKVDDLLSSVAKQDFLQQDLMNKGLNAVSELGIPIDKLDPGALAGTALNAAKSITDTFNWATGGDIGSALKSQFDQVARAAEFATSFADSKLNDAMTQTAEPGAAEDTANRDTVDAAVARVTGNAKIPEVKYAPATPTAAAVSVQIGREINDIFFELTIFTKQKFTPFVNSGAAENRDSEKPDVARLVNDYKTLEQLAADIQSFKGQALGLERRASAFEEKFGTPAINQYTELPKLFDLLDMALANVASGLAKYKTRIDSLSV